MSLHNLAKELEKTGRGKDSMLVHMTPKEVQGLQTLAKAHGGSLTVNPNTGLVEAGWLDSILPMVAGAALTATGIGAPMAALLVGGGTGLMTGSVEKGLMAGLGAYGGAGIGEGLAAAGSSAAPEAAKMAVAENAGNLGNQFAFNGAGEMVPANYAPSVTGAAQGTAMQTAPVQNAGFADKLKMMGQGLTNLGDEKARDVAYANIPKYALPAAGASLAAGALEPKPMDPNAGKQTLDEKYKKYPYAYELSPNFQGSTPTPPNPAYRPTGLGYSGYADGGVIPDAMAPGGLAALQGMRDGYDAPQTATGDEVQMASGGDLNKKKRASYTSAAKLAAMDPYQAGIAELNNAKYAANMSGDFSIPTRMQELGDIPLRAARGTYLKGAGDGMSDSIPATINGTQPARLADGEFVVPADVVSHIGNGSSDAGAKKLYKMMDKVRMARTGKKSQAPAVKTDKYMPA